MKLLLCNFESNHKTSTINTEPDTYFIFSVKTLAGYEYETKAGAAPGFNAKKKMSSIVIRKPYLIFQ